ncbi:hypothetical protein BDF20DRAFT_910507 [Mycotypha africana]|uniref:uncharacterized protein n=1 Tax=Mycotypha africana TaxID=64632 RepID=UPI002300618B|nr:uncharacterized protein BDF20DRAFT_910507 [Mycotypha africana]KAI8987952.1 hypothetical protein BDF20DRAFT_910507 [Mycotypha africana]
MVSAIPILKGVEPRYRRSANPEEMIGEYGSSDNTKMNIDKNMFIRNNFVRITEIADVDNTDEFILLE